MIDRVQGVALGVSALLLVAVLELVRRRRLLEEYALVWIAAALMLLGLSARPDVLHVAAAWLGIHYPPAVLMLLHVVLVFIAALGFSVIVSRQRRQIERLIEDTSVLAAELRQLRSERTGDRASAGSTDHEPAAGSPNRPRT